MKRDRQQLQDYFDSLPPQDQDDMIRMALLILWRDHKIGLFLFAAGIVALIWWFFL